MTILISVKMRRRLRLPLKVPNRKRVSQRQQHLILTWDFSSLASHQLERVKALKLLNFHQKDYFSFLRWLETTKLTIIRSKQQ